MPNQYNKKKEAPAEPRPKSKKQRRWQTEHAESGDESDNDDLIPAALTRKITMQARQQQEEEAAAAGPSGLRDRPGAAGACNRPRAQALCSCQSLDPAHFCAVRQSCIPPLLS